MFLRKVFQEFLVLHSEAEPLPPPPPRPDEREPDLSPEAWLIDWRWLEACEDVP